MQIKNIPLKLQEQKLDPLHAPPLQIQNAPKPSETDIYVIKRGSTCVPRIVWTDPSCIDLWDYKL